MNHTVTILIGVLIPLAGTTLGAAMVFFLRGTFRPGLQKALLGFASGVMLAASVWSLLIPAIDMAAVNGSRAPWLPAVTGFLLGVGFLLLLDTVIPHLHMDADCPEGKACGLGKSLMLVLAVTLHNIPEGMAVGVVLAGSLTSGQVITAAGALALSAGIAMQNFPEGAIISMPLVSSGLSRGRAFRYGFLSGVVEPAGALLTIWLASLITPVLPYVLAFAAGAMIYVVVEELIPQAQAEPHSNVGTIGAALGFALMMLLDVALG